MFRLGFQYKEKHKRRLCGILHGVSVLFDICYYGITLHITNSDF